MHSKVSTRALPSVRDIATRSMGITIGDAGDRSSLEHEIDVTIKMVGINQEEELDKKDFLHRIEAGVADICADCGDPISSARRLAKPFTTRCVTCQVNYD